jgi:hypothetical protein
MTNGLHLSIAALAALTIATAAGAQECRIDYQRAGVSGAEQLALGAGQLQALATGAAGDPVGAPAPSGGAVRWVANRGSAPLSLALVGPAIPGRQATDGGTIVKAMGGLSGGVIPSGGSHVTSMGALPGGVLPSVQRIASLGGGWLALQPGERIDGLTHALAAVACVATR